MAHDVDHRVALGVVLYAVRGYLNTGDKVLAGALIRRLGGHRDRGYRPLLGP
jgi:hypothetical protein